MNALSVNEWPAEARPTAGSDGRRSAQVSYPIRSKQPDILQNSSLFSVASRGGKHSRFAYALVILALLIGCGGTGGNPTESPTPAPTPVNTAPVVEIQSPQVDGTVGLGAATKLQGRAFDMETGAAELEVRWESDVEGLLGVSTPDESGYVTFSAQFKKAGAQTVTLAAVDAQGLRSEVSIRITVDGPPTAEIGKATPSSPKEGELVVITGTVSDPEDDLDLLSITWTDDKGKVLGAAAPDSRGNVELETDDLAAGKRTITLTVEDSFGHEATDTLKITVEECEDVDKDGFTECEGDCDDGNAQTYPNAEEQCDGKDNDCDSKIDEGLTDSEGDGIPDCRDNCVDVSNGTQSDGDSDGIGNSCDNCADVSNPDQLDSNSDGIGNACQLDLCNGVDDNGDGEIDEYSKDEYEANESLSTAHDFGDINGITEPKSFSWDATIHSAQDSDWFHIYISDDPTALGEDEFYLDVTLSNIPAGVNLDLYLWWDFIEDGEGNPFLSMQSNQSSNGDEHVLQKGISVQESGGNFWIEVRYVSGLPCQGYYRISTENMG